MTAETAASGAGSGVREALGETWASLHAVFANSALRRIQLAFGGSLIGDSAYAIALAVWAYGVGGARAIGVWLAVRYVLAALVSPVASVVADRASRKRVMIGSDILRCAVVAAAAVCLYLHTPPWPIFVLGTLVSVLSTLYRPALMAWMPGLVSRPEELTASNGTSSTLESLAFFVGPAVGALLLAVTDVPAVFLVNAATFAWSAVLVAGVRPRTNVPAGNAALGEPTSGETLAGETSTGEAASGEGDSPRMWEEVTAGFKAIGQSRDLLMVASLVSLQTIVAGALMVFNVVMAAHFLSSGARGVGYLEAVLGVGAIIGGIVAIGRAARPRLAGDLMLGVVLWSLPLALVAIVPSAAPMFVAMALIGFANALVDVSSDTILQRMTPDAVLGRVFGAVEGLLIATMALGSLVTPYLIDWLGLRWTLAVVGVVVAASVVPWARRARRLDRSLGEPEGVDLLREITFFQPVAPPTLDGLARQLGRTRADRGEVILRQGEISDRFFVIESGRVEVTQDGRVLREEGQGDYFGEIGLLRDEPRSATVTAMEPTELRTLDREHFLPAVTGSEAASVALEEIVSRRLAV